MKYPKGIIKSQTHDKSITYGNRGMHLENDLNLTNTYYRQMDRAIIYKKPTPVKITKAEYPGRHQVIIKEAFFEMPSTTDYNGVYQGQYVDFEAKETTNNTSFPLSNIHPHQLEHMQKIVDHHGICFLIVRFTRLNATYLLFAKDLFTFLNHNQRKSIPLSYFQEKGYQIPDKIEPRVDYLKVIDEIYGGGNHNEKETSKKNSVQ